MSSTTSSSINGYTPPLNIRLRFMSVGTSTVMDCNYTEGGEFRMWDLIPDHKQQEFKIIEANGMGYYIVHAETGRSVIIDAGTINSQSGSVRMVTREHYGNVFVFERINDDAVVIRLADKRNCVLLPEGGSKAAGTQVTLWPLRPDQQGVNPGFMWSIQKLE